jgi:hypothetical protein
VIEALREAERLAHGIPYRRDDLAPLVDLARAGGISLPHGL